MPQNMETVFKHPWKRRLYLKTRRPVRVSRVVHDEGAEGCRGGGGPRLDSAGSMSFHFILRATRNFKQVSGVIPLYFHFKLLLQHKE